MSWKSIYDHIGGEANDLAFSPNGGKAKWILLGIVVPIGIVWYAVRCWIHQEALWIGDRHSAMIVTGRTAKPVALCWFFAGLFMHSRWFWGLLPWHRVYDIGTVLSVLGFLAAGGVAFYEVMRFGA